MTCKLKGILKPEFHIIAQHLHPVFRIPLSVALCYSFALTIRNRVYVLEDADACSIPKKRG